MIMHPKLWSQDTNIRKYMENTNDKENFKIVTLNSNKEMIKYQKDWHDKGKIITETKERGFLGLHLNANGWKTLPMIRTTKAKIALSSIQRFKDFSPKNKKTLCICRMLYSCVPWEAQPGPIETKMQVIQNSRVNMIGI